MTKRIISFFVGLIFLAFAFFQWNDPDAIRWMLAYGSVSLLFFSRTLNIINHKVSRLMLITASCAAALYFPDIINWFKQGMPSIVESMKAESPHVEFVREFFGLLIMILSLVLYPKLILSDDD